MNWRVIKCVRQMCDHITNCTVLISVVWKWDTDQMLQCYSEGERKERERDLYIRCCTSCTQLGQSWWFKVLDYISEMIKMGSEHSVSIVVDAGRALQPTRQSHGVRGKTLCVLESSLLKRFSSIFVYFLASSFESQKWSLKIAYYIYADAPHHWTLLHSAVCASC